MVSVIITTYKREPKMVRRAIDSVLIQTYKDFELIVVDDSPSDYVHKQDIKSMVEDINDERIRLIQHKENKGACAARNTGINFAKGEFIAFLDDDDEWLPKKLQLQTDAFTGQEIGLVYCDYQIINLNNGSDTIRRVKEPKGDSIIEQLLKENFIGSTSFPLIRKECFIHCGMFDTMLQSSQDVEMWLRIVQQYETAHVRQALAKYYIHTGEQITSNPAKKLQAIEEINIRYKLYIENNSILHGVRILKLAQIYSMAGEMKKALGFWLKAVRISPFSIYYNSRYLLSMIKHYRGTKT